MPRPKALPSRAHPGRDKRAPAFRFIHRAIEGIGEKARCQAGQGGGGIQSEAAPGVRRRLHGRNLRPAEEELWRNLVCVEGMHGGGHRSHQRRQAPGSGFPRRPAGRGRQLVGFPGIPQKEGDRGAEALRHRRPSGNARGNREAVPAGEAPALPRPRPKELH